MKKQFITGFISGALICGAIGAAAAVYQAQSNTFPIQLNGTEVNMEGYNINGYTYFKLRDIADTIGGFNVDFQNNTIQISKDGYVYENISKPQPLGKLSSDSDGYTYYVDHPSSDFMIYNFNINSGDAVRMNQEMYDEMSYFSYGEIDWLDSYTFQYGSICSIVTSIETNLNDYRTTIARTIDVQTGEEVTYSQLCAYAGVSENDLKNQIKNKLLEEYTSSIAIAPSMASDAAKQQALSDDNIGDFFIDEEGSLCVNLHYFSFAGGYDSWYSTGYKLVNAPVIASAPDWYMTYNSYTRVRDVGDLTISAADGDKFIVSYTDGSGSAKEWTFDAISYETGEQGELIYQSGEYTLTYYPNDNHIQISADTYTYTGMYVLN